MSAPSSRISACASLYALRGRECGGVRLVDRLGRDHQRAVAVGRQADLTLHLRSRATGLGERRAVVGVGHGVVAGGQERLALVLLALRLERGAGRGSRCRAECSRCRGWCLRDDRRQRAYRSVTSRPAASGRRRCCGGMPKNSDTLPVTSTEAPTAGEVLLPMNTKMPSEAPGVASGSAGLHEEAGQVAVAARVGAGDDTLGGHDVVGDRRGSRRCPGSRRWSASYGAGLTVMVNSVLAVPAVGVAESVTVAVTVDTPAAVGVPLSTPSAVSVMPSGRPVKPQLYVRRGAAGRREGDRRDRHADGAGLVAGVGRGEDTLRAVHAVRGPGARAREVRGVAHLRQVPFADTDARVTQSLVWRAAQS